MSENNFLWRAKKKFRSAFFSAGRAIFGPDIIHRSRFAGWLNNKLVKLQDVLSPARRKQAKFEKNHPDMPWFAREAIPFIEKNLKPDYIGFEWGSGRSTVWFAKRIKHITSVEGRESWHNEVKKMLKKENIENKVDLRLAKISNEHNYSPIEVNNYVSQIDNFKKFSLDVVTVDGHCRIPCLKNCLEKIKPGGMLILDNSDLPEFNEFHKIMKNIESKTFTNKIWETSVFFCPEKGFPKF